MITRWGTCNTAKRKLWFNLQLAKKTPDCLEYSILRELLHFVESRHNERFTVFMDKYMPSCRDVKKRLNRQRLDYME
jgi:predicted metal-dependent hydrolase